MLSMVGRLPIMGPGLEAARSAGRSISRRPRGPASTMPDGVTATAASGIGCVTATRAKVSPRSRLMAMLPDWSTSTTRPSAVDSPAVMLAVRPVSSARQRAPWSWLSNAWPRMPKASTPSAAPDAAGRPSTPKKLPL